MSRILILRSLFTTHYSLLTMLYDVIIIGAGPAGLSAGIYICRKKLSALVLSKDIGGQTAKSWEVENYLGYSLISGADLAQKFKEHLDSFKCVSLKTGAEVASIKKSNGLFEVITKKREKYLGKTVIIASGKNPKMLNVPGEEEFRGRGLTYCATCDGPLFSGKDVAVVGQGNSAMGATYQLAKIARLVYLLIKGPKLRSDLDKILAENALAADNVKVIYNALTTKVKGDKAVSGLEYQDQKTKEIKKLSIQGIFVEIGSVPSAEFCRGLVKMNKLGEIIVDKANMTSVPGIFAAGDVSDVIEKQTIIAAGEGAKAAIAAAKYLSSRPE